MKDVLNVGIFGVFYIGGSILGALIYSVLEFVKSGGKKNFGLQSKLMILIAGMVWPISVPAQIIHTRILIKRSMVAEQERIEFVSKLTGKDEFEAEELIDTFKEAMRQDKEKKD